MRYSVYVCVCVCVQTETFHNISAKHGFPRCESERMPSALPPSLTLFSRKHTHPLWHTHIRNTPSLWISESCVWIVHHGAAFVSARRVSCAESLMQISRHTCSTAVGPEKTSRLRGLFLSLAQSRRAPAAPLALGKYLPALFSSTN